MLKLYAKYSSLQNNEWIDESMEQNIYVVPYVANKSDAQK